MAQAVFGADANPMQGQQPLPMLGSEFRFAPGSWALYKLAGKESAEAHKMYFAVLDEVKQRKGKKAYWMEIEVYTNDQPAVVTRLLVPDTGEGPGDAQKAYVQIAGYRPFEVPRKYLKPNPKKKQEGVGQFMKYDLSGEPREKTLQWKGRSLKAATVKARDAKGNPTEVTVSLEAPPLCIVTLDSPDTKMELLDWGTGAKTKIVGKPVGMWRWVWGVAAQAAENP